MNQCILNNEDYLNCILNNFNTLIHSNLVIFLRVNKLFKKIIESIIKNKFNYEMIMLTKIKKKIEYNIDLYNINFNIKSIE